MNPRGGVAVASCGGSSSALYLRAVAFTELFHLVAALDGGLLGATGGERATFGDPIGDFLPVRSPEIASPERIPLFTVGVNEGYGLIVGPTRRRQAAGSGGG